jgi:hypothetical protein
MHPSTSPQAHRIARGLLLALAILLVQQHAALHWLAHAIAATHAKASSGSTQPDHCDECLALSAFGAAAPSAHTPLTAGTAQHALVAPTPVAALAAALQLAFRSRAPPIPI